MWRGGGVAIKSETAVCGCVKVTLRDAAGKELLRKSIAHTALWWVNLKGSIALSLPTVYTCYWDNIDATVLSSQKNVFEKLGIPLRQINTNRVPHGVWMTEVARNAGGGDIIIFCDIDAFPINYEIYEKALKVAGDGGIFGMAQVANHLNKSQIYAGPMFMAFSRETYNRLGSPDLSHSATCDPAQLLSVVAMEQSFPIHLEYPRNVIIPKWPLADMGVFGVGTFYGNNDVFHLFESRHAQNVKLFNAVSEDVASGRLNFSNYLEIASEGLMVGEKKSLPLAKLLSRIFKVVGGG